MAKHTYYTCDRCGNKLPDDHATLAVIIDRRADAAGSMENVCEHIDLCQKCLVYAVQRLLLLLDYNQRREFIKTLRLRKEVG